MSYYNRLTPEDQAWIDDIRDHFRAKGSEPIVFVCGPSPAPEDHKCDIKGQTVDIPHGNGVINSATCSVCGRAAFDSWSVWDV